MGHLHVMKAQKRLIDLLLCILCKFIFLVCIEYSSKRTLLNPDLSKFTLIWNANWPVIVSELNHLKSDACSN